MIYSNSEPKVWRNGVEVSEKHLDASGNPPPAPAQGLTDEWLPMPLSDMHSGVIDGFTVGIHQRINAETGRREAKAWAYAYGETEQLLESPIFGLVLDADETSVLPPDRGKSPAMPVSGFFANSEGSRERYARAAVVRSHMKPDERSGLDMIAEARKLQADAHRIEADWRAKQEKLAEEKRLDDEAIELYRKWQRGKLLVEKGRKS